MSAEKTAHTVSCSSMCEALIGTQTNSSTKRFIYISCVFIRLKLYEVHSSSSFPHFSYFAIMIMMVMMMTFACLHIYLFFLCLICRIFFKTKNNALARCKQLVIFFMLLTIFLLLIISVSSSNIDTILFMMETNFSCCCCRCMLLSFLFSFYLYQLSCLWIHTNECARMTICASS